MTDVTIPADDARELAAYLRQSCHRSTWTDEMADLLDPPPPSLREEICEQVGLGRTRGVVADAVLAIFRRHVEGLDRVGIDQISDLAYLADGDLLYRDDVLQLLGAGDE